MKGVIYSRVSNTNQSVSRQINDLKKNHPFKSLEITRTFSEAVSGFSKKLTERDQLQKMLRFVDENSVDIILIHEISRLGRNTHETLTLLKQLEENGIQLYIHNLGITLNKGAASDDIFSKLIVTIVSDLARLESEQLSYRIKSGIADRKRKGRTTGRRIGSKENTQRFLAKSKTKAIQKYITQGMSYSEIQKLCGSSYSTISKVKRLLEEEA